MTQSQHRPLPGSPITRRAALAGGVGVAAGAASGALAAPAARADTRGGATPDRYAARAAATYAALQRYFYDPQTGFYLEEYPHTSQNPWSYVWPFSQALIGTQAMAGIRGRGARYRDDVADRFRALEAYWNGETDPPGYDSYLRPPYGGGGDKFYDDNEWIALAFLQKHYMSPRGDRAAVRRAKQIFDLVVHGWDTDPSHPCPGGVFWTQADWSQDRNTVSNAPGAEVGLRLYRLTRNRYHLEWSLHMYEWVRSYMLAPNGLYWDHVDLAGVINTVQWSYNQGTMIGAGALLYRATGRRRYLEQARETAAIALDFYAEDERYFTQPAQFHAIFFANLLQLAAIKPDRAYRAAMAWYADEARARFRDPETGIYRFHDDAPTELLLQAAMVRIEAMLAWNPRDYHLLT